MPAEDAFPLLVAVTDPIDGARPQDVGRRHARKGSPSPETLALLTRYQATMRDEMRGILEALSAVKPVGLLDVAPELAIPLGDAQRDRLWDRAVKLGRELGSAIDADPAPAASSPKTTRRSRKRVD